MMDRLTKYSRAIMLVEAVLITVLAALLLYGYVKPEPRTNDQPNLLTHFDQQDLNRMKEAVSRFEEGKGDNLTLLEWGTDSGPFIHNFYNDGRELHWLFDNSRDGYAANPGMTEYVCRAIELVETREHYTVDLSKCNGYPKDQKIGIISFLKDEL